MNAIKIALGMIVLAGVAKADPVADVAAAVNATFDRMPVIQRVAQIEGRCGADEHVNDVVAYCAPQNRVFLVSDAIGRPEAAYMLAHVMGHAAQIQHGVADVALATIRANRDQEDVLRADVTRQVECVAGVFYTRAGLPRADLTDWFSTEPFTGSHWGRDPLSVGPKVSIGLAERAAWFARGQGGDLAACATQSFGAELLIAAFKG